MRRRSIIVNPSPVEGVNVPRGDPGKYGNPIRRKGPVTKDTDLGNVDILDTLVVLPRTLVSSGSTRVSRGVPVSRIITVRNLVPGSGVEGRSRGGWRLYRFTEALQDRLDNTKVLRHRYTSEN